MGSDWKLRRDRAIQDQFDHMTQKKGLRAGFAIRELAKQYDRAERTIRNIVYADPVDLPSNQAD